MSVLKWVITLIFLFVLVIFGARNWHYVDVRYYFGTVRMPMFILMSILVLIGALLAAVVGMMDQLKLRAKMRKQTKIIKNLEKEIARVKPALPSFQAEEESGEIEAG